MNPSTLSLQKSPLPAGASEVRPVEDRFYGNRMDTLKDPFGYICFLSTHKEDLISEEIQKRAEALFKPENV